MTEPDRAVLVFGLDNSDAIKASFIAPVVATVDDAGLMQMLRLSEEQLEVITMPKHKTGPNGYVGPQRLWPWYGCKVLSLWSQFYEPLYQLLADNANGHPSTASFGPEYRRCGSRLQMKLDLQSYNRIRCQLLAGESGVALQLDTAEFYARVQGPVVYTALRSFGIEPRFVDEVSSFVDRCFASGLPLGHPTSVLLAEIVQRAIDHSSQIGGRNGEVVAVRWADDRLIHANSHENAQRYEQQIVCAHDEFGLELQTAKTHIYDPSCFRYLARGLNPGPVRLRQYETEGVREGGSDDDLGYAGQRHANSSVGGKFDHAALYQDEHRADGPARSASVELMNFRALLALDSPHEVPFEEIAASVARRQHLVDKFGRHLTRRQDQRDQQAVWKVYEGSPYPAHLIDYLISSAPSKLRITASMKWQNHGASPIHQAASLRAMHNVCPDAWSDLLGRMFACPRSLPSCSAVALCALNEDGRLGRVCRQWLGADALGALVFAAANATAEHRSF